MTEMSDDAVGTAADPLADAVATGDIAVADPATADLAAADMSAGDMTAADMTAAGDLGDPEPSLSFAPAPEPSVVAADRGGPQARDNGRKVREGIVTSTSMEKTAIVTVTERVRHPLYRKTLQRTKKLYAHDEANSCRVGDRVRVAETRPMSKLKRWRLVDVLERAR